MKKVTRVLLFTIVAAMLLSFAPFYAFAIVHDAPTADAVITVAGGVPVTVSKDKTEYILEFTAPEDGDYVIWSEAGYADDLYVEMYDADGDYVSDNDDMINERYYYNFKLAFEAAEGEKYYFAVSSFDHIIKTTANVFVKKAVPATGIEVIEAPNPATTFSGEYFYLNYRLLPANAAPEDVNIESSDPSVVNTEYGTLEYSNVGEATVTLSLERDATIKTSFDVKVISPIVPKINLGEVASPTTNKFEFTAPEDGTYVFYSTELGLLFSIDDGPEGEKTVLDMTKGESVYVTNDNSIFAVMSHGGIGVNKATDDKAFELALYMEHPITPFPLKAETVYPGKGIVIAPELTDPASVHELDIDFEIEPSADVTAEKADGVLFAEFGKPGTYTVSAQDNGGNKVTKTIVVSDYNKVTLDKPYVHTFEKTLFNGSLIPVQFPVSFTAPENGNYYIEVSDDMGLSNTLTLFGDSPYGEVTSICGPLSKDETVVLDVLTFGNGDATFKTGTANITVTAKEFVDVTDISLPETVTVHLGQAKTVDILPVPANGNILYQEIDVDTTDEIYAYIQGNKLVIDAIDVEEPCEATVNVEYKGEEIQKTINVNVIAPRKLQLGVPAVVEDGSLCEAFEFTAPGDGAYSFVVDNARASAGEYELLDTEDSLLASSSRSSVSYYYNMGDTDVIRLTPLKDGGSITVTEAVDATSMYVPGGMISMAIAERIEYYELAQRYVRTTPENAVTQTITKVTVADPSVAVFVNGQLIALKKGTTKIELESDYGLKTTAMLQVVEVEPIIPSKVYLNKQELTLEEGESETLVATAEPIENVEFYWMSSDESVVTVDQNGKITAKSAGTATVSASYFGVFTECTVTVTKKVAPPPPEKPPVQIKDTTKIFKDVEAGRWYVNAINYNYSYGFIAGMSADTFGVSNQITRGQFITILARIAGVDTSADANKTTTKFTDVESGRFYTAAIKWASDNKIVAGMTDTTFAPTAPIQRQQLCVMIVNFAKNQKIELTAAESAVTFADAAQIGNYAKEAVAVCQRADIINGYNEGGKLVVKPANTATRAEAAQILYKFHKDFVSK